MKKYNITITYFLLTIVAVSAQNSRLVGKVLFQNSGKKPAVLVKVMGLDAKSDHTTSSGKFILDYERKTSGASAQISIVPFDKNKTPLEIVNIEEVNNARIPDNPNEEFYIFVCRAGQLAEARQHYYNLCDSNLRKKYEILKTDKKRLLLQTNISNKEKASLQFQIDSLDATLKAALKKAEDLTNYMASINKDFANAILKDAINKIEKEQDIEGALQILKDNDSKLKMKGDIGITKIMSGTEEVKEVIQTYEFEIKLLSTQFRYKEIVSCYEKIIDLYEKSKIDNFYLLLSYQGLANTYSDMGKDLKALETHKKIINKIDTKSWSRMEAIMYLTTSFFIGRTYKDLSKTDSALFYLNILESTINSQINSKKDSVAPELESYFYDLLISIYDALNQSYRKADSLEKATIMGNKAIFLVENRYGKEDKRLSYLYHNMSMVYLMAKKYQMALDFERHSIEFKENIKPINYKSLFRSYTNLAYIQYLIKEYRNEAFITLNKAKVMGEDNFEADDINLATVYSQLGFFYKNDSILDSAIILYKKAAAIYSINEDSENYISAISSYYEAMGDKNNNAKNYKFAIYYYDSAYLLNRNIENLNNIGSCFIDLKNYPEAIKYYKKVILLDTIKSITYINNDIGFAYAKNGQLENAFKHFKEFEEQQIDTPRAYRNWAMYYAISKNKERAIEFLDKAVTSGYKNLIWITNDESLELIRGDERYKQLLDKLNRK